MNDFLAVNEVYLKYFTEDSKPARSCVAIKDFPHKNPAIKVGIDSIAIVPRDDGK
jgi:2-iminobutanoate/2-iminopropanoate deaminase